MDTRYPPRLQRWRYTAGLVPLLSGALALALYWTTAAPTITTRHGGTDGAELAAVALSGGVPHPSGYPTYMLLARLLLRLPLGEPAWRLTLLSALSGALAVAATAALLINASSEHDRRAAVCAGLTAGGLLALSPRLWSQTIIPEVYALQLLWLVLCAQLVLWWLRGGQRWTLLLAGVIVGLGLGVHLTLAAVVPAALLAWWASPRRPRIALRWLPVVVAALLAGLAVYGLLPIWASRRAVPSWGQANTAVGLWAHVSGAEYAYLVGIVPWPQRLARLSFAARDLLTQPGLYGLALALGWGWPYGWQRQRPLLVFSAAVAGCSLLFALSYGGADGTVYLLPWTWTWSLWAGLGVQGLLAAELPLPRRVVAAGLIAGIVLACGWQLHTYGPRLNLRDDHSERERIVAGLRDLPPHTVLLTAADADTFGIWYVQQALRLRLDVLALDLRLAQQPWYQQQIRAALQTPGASDLCAALHASGRPLYRWQAGQLSRASAAVVCPQS